MITLHSGGLGESSNLYNGSEYVFTNHGITGHPFFESAQPIRGEVYYDGSLYTHVPLAYDLVQDEILLTGTGQGFDLKLIENKVGFFKLGDHRFIRIHPDSLRSSTLSPGFYELLYKGKVEVLARRIKKVHEGLKADDPYSYVQYNAYYVRDQRSVYKIDSRRSLLQAFGDRKDRVKKNYRQQGLNFKKRPEEAIVRTAESYDE
jgi:hypothetical protein